MPLPNSNFLKEHLNSGVFIETGSHRGDGIAYAMEAGFPCIYSVDIAPFAYGWCCHRFQKDNTRVYLFLDDSRQFLKNVVLPTLTSRATFWLDAHWCGGNGEMDGADGGYEHDCPLIGELLIIRDHRIRNHTILIDDVRLLGGPHFPSQEHVLSVLEMINPDYSIDFVDSEGFEKDILVARIKT